MRKLSRGQTKTIERVLAIRRVLFRFILVIPESQMRRDAQNIVLNYIPCLNTIAGLHIDEQT